MIMLSEENDRWFSGSSTRMTWLSSAFLVSASMILSELCSPLPTNWNGRSSRCGTRVRSHVARWRDVDRQGQRAVADLAWARRELGVDAGDRGDVGERLADAAVRAGQLDALAGSRCVSMICCMW